jgi:hypothetical protein
MVFPHVIPELPSESYCSDGGFNWKGVTPLSEGVDHNHNRIIAVQLQKLNNKVNTYRVPTGFWRWQRFEVTGWQLPLNFGPETEVTCCGEVRCCETNLKHNTQKKTNFSYNEMLRSLSFMGSSPRLEVFTVPHVFRGVRTDPRRILTS